MAPHLRARRVHQTASIPDHKLVERYIEWRPKRDVMSACRFGLVQLLGMSSWAQIMAAKGPCVTESTENGTSC